MSSVSSDKVTMHERAVYNNYLIITRSVKNKPWKARVNFSNFDEDKLIQCRKVSKKLLR